VVPPQDDEHDCGWKAYAQAQAEEIVKLKEQMAALERRILGHKSERRPKSKLPPPVPRSSSASAAADRREANRALLEARLEHETVQVPVPAEKRCCPKCGEKKLRPVGSGKASAVIEYVQPHFRRRTFVRETLACRCGHMVTAAAPGRIGKKTQYAPSFVAHLITTKCRDSFPQYRLEKAYRSLGLPLSRSTMCDLLHRGADTLRPLYDVALSLVPKAADVHADETSIRQLGTKKRAFFWDFVTPDLVVYRYAPTRSGDVPEQVLGDSEGRLVVDAYTGYNRVTTPGRRTRAGCLAHARRKLFEQREHPEVAEALDLIGEIYVVERDAKDARIVGTDAHLEVRRLRSRPLFARLLRWAHRHRELVEPRSGLGRAIRYILKNWRELGRFLRHATIPPDNNLAEAALRRIALGRGNFLFIGNEQAGHNFAVLYTLVASCEKHDVNPIDYLTDVLTRTAAHSPDRLVDLLPHRWRPP
jgi:transposase